MNAARVLIAGVCLLLMCVVGPARAQGADDDVTGLWFYQTQFAVGLEGEMTLSRRGDRWRGEIGGVAAEGVRSGRDVRIQFPDEGGLFRGRTDERGRLQSGFWVRREMLDDGRYPEGAAQAYATPLALNAAGANRWRATVAPLQDPFTLYLNIFRDESGALRAAIRNPEHHRYGPAMQLLVTRDGPVLRLAAAAEPTEGDLTATLMSNPERISLYWQALNRFIALRRATPAQAALFTARPRDGTRYAYRQPEDLGDGWPIARARDLGVDEAALERVVQRIIDIDPSSQRAWLIHSIAVAYRGQLILDEYFYGHGPDTPHDMRSASKAFSGVTLGAVMMEGAPISPETQITRLMAPMGPFANPDPRKDRITVGRALTHTTGLACDDAFEEPLSPGNESVMQTQREQPNWWRFMLDLPMAHEPGERYAYCSGGINLAGGALTTATGEWLPALFDRTVARPLQFGRYHWNVMPNGEGYVGGGAFVRTRDFLKIGQAYLDGGVWNGRRIATGEWTRIAMSPQVHISPATTGLSREQFSNFYFETDEGYAWHMVDMRSGDQRYRVIHTNGNGGQLLLVVPQFDLVVMFTAGNYRQGLWNRERDDITGDMIIPALSRGPNP
jgi:CubicO group peptidase (beta-lactamase class C family)